MYVKIFEQIFDSSVSEDYQTRLVFTDLLVLADEDGIVDMTVEAIARRTNVPLEIVRTGIQKLEQPDPQSRSKDESGRRLVRLDDHRDWGWKIVNYEKYRMLRTKEDRKQYHREYYRSNRSKEARSQHGSTALNNPQQTQPSAYASASELRNTENKEERSDVPVTDVPFAAEPEPGYTLEPQRVPESAEQRAIIATAQFLWDHHEQHLRGSMERLQGYLRNVARKEGRRPASAVMELVRKQYARWRDSASWREGYVHSMFNWLENGVWQDDPPRDMKQLHSAPPVNRYKEIL